MLKHKAKLENALESTDHPHSVTSSCLSYREGREGIDIVHDNVEINLLKVSQCVLCKFKVTYFVSSKLTPTVVNL